MPLTWETTPTAAYLPMLDDYIGKIRADVLALAQRYASEITAWMKVNAPWADHTGNARQGLSALASRLSLDLVEIALAYNVDYGVYLELAHAGMWAIIAPAIDYFAPRIWADVQAMLS